jgi:hypothetical protein
MLQKLKGSALSDNKGRKNIGKEIVENYRNTQENTTAKGGSFVQALFCDL